MKVLFVSTHSCYWTPHWETELEIMQRHLDAGDSVRVLHCNGELMTCEVNPYHHRANCRRCIGRRKAGLALLSAKVNSSSFLNLTAADRKELIGIPKKYPYVYELKEARIENFDFGFAVSSSIISIMRDHNPSLANSGNFLARFMIAALSMYRSVQNYLATHSIDRVYVFNGRFATCRGVLRACQSRTVPCFVHERGHDMHHYVVDENHTQLDLDYIEQCIRNVWNNAVAQPDRAAIAEKFYADRMKGRAQSWYAFTTGQADGLLPGNWDGKRHNIVIFNSSEDEFAAIGKEWQNPLYRDQQEGLERVLATLSQCHQNLHVYLRIHPNLKGLDNTQIRSLAALRGEFLTVIPPEDPVSTYTLMRNASVVLTFGSTVGIEAAFWNKPSIMVGKAYYGNLGSTYNPTTHEELIDLLMRDLPPKDKEGALMYGYFLNTVGTPFQYFEPTDLFNGTFKGQVIRPIKSFGTLLSEKWNRFAHILFAVQARLKVLHGLRLSSRDNSNDTPPTVATPRPPQNFNDTLKK